MRVGDGGGIGVMVGVDTGTRVKINGVEVATDTTVARVGRAVRVAAQVALGVRVSASQPANAKIANAPNINIQKRD